MIEHNQRSFFVPATIEYFKIFSPISDFALFIAHVRFPFINAQVFEFKYQSDHQFNGLTLFLMTLPLDPHLIIVRRKYCFYIHVQSGMFFSYGNRRLHTRISLFTRPCKENLKLHDAVVLKRHARHTSVRIYVFSTAVRITNQTSLIHNVYRDTLYRGSSIFFTRHKV